MNIKKITAFAAAFVLFAGVLTAVPKMTGKYDGQVAAADESMNAEDSMLYAEYDHELDGWAINPNYTENPRDTLTVQEEYKGIKVVRIKGSCFDAAMIKHVYIPDTVKKIDADAVCCGSDPDNNRENFRITYKGKTYTYNERGKPYQAVNGWKHTKSGFYYEYDKEMDGMIITTYDGGRENVKIPRKIRGKNVIAIGDSAFRYDSSNSVNSPFITSVSVPDTVTEIGTNAFTYCMSLKEVKLGKGLKKLDDSAFSFCRNLEKIEIPDSVTDIGNYVFDVCDSITVTYKGKKYTSEEWCEIYG